MPSRSDFPGLQRSPRKNGLVALHWVATRVAVAAGYTPKTVPLLNFLDGSPQLAKRCQDLRAEMEQWLADRKRADKPIRVHGTFRSLIAIYEADEVRPYQPIP